MRETTAQRLKRRKKVLRKAAQRSLTYRTPLVLLSPGEEHRTGRCGPCTACCTVVGVQQLTPTKPPWHRCQHQAPSSPGGCDKGCSIYDSRPNECRDYYCMYLGGMLKGGEEMRPDNFGMIVEMRGPEDLVVLVMWEVWPGAADQPKVLEFAEKLKAHNRPIVIRKHGSVSKFTLICPQSHYHQVVAWLKADAETTKRLEAEKLTQIEEMEHAKDN